MAWLPRTEVSNILDHLQRALHLHQAVEWRAALGQHMPARRERRLRRSAESHTHTQTVVSSPSGLCPRCAAITETENCPEPLLDQDGDTLPVPLQRSQGSLRVWVGTGWSLPLVETTLKKKRGKGERLHICSSAEAALEPSEATPRA